jgi:hypothetical protein
VAAADGAFVKLDTVKTVANLISGDAAALLERLRNEGVPADMVNGAQVEPVETSEIVVEDAHFDRACDIAEAWEAERIAEAAKRKRMCCPKCQSPTLESVPHDKLDYIYRCAACGCEIAP